MKDKSSTKKVDQYVCLIGSQKAGTTSVFHYLAEHPTIHAIAWKEGKLFLDDPAKPSHVRRFDRLTAGRSPRQWLFETSTYYTKHPRHAGVPENIAKRYPDARFIYLVRDPVERIWSQYCDYRSRTRNWESRSFEDAIRANPDYLNFSRYHMQISRYLDVFPQERILVLVFEEFIRDKVAGLRSVFRFLQIDENFVPPNLDVRYNDGGSKRSMSPLKRCVVKMPGYRQLPWRFRKWMKHSVGPPLPVKHEVFTEDIRIQLADELHDDTQRFVDWLGRDVLLWKSMCQPEAVRGQRSKAS